ncbi:hypothetical protein I302_105689 [Kwoniella bestiolae CBS 10118]|uniref:Uncharacterized protein n=1 Tax=Kwoniella bestiolae CBS 10118 TaxID=1296100 RepID=A0A1B9G1V3_9TREE|nr:hypothetical protein I302_04809 [Kwoniella bestiolae CBS 10118]OCF24999.1 hypothetical protein I302_04809 [Kwoniella bestiolae CBS 10118]
MTDFAVSSGQPHHHPVNGKLDPLSSFNRNIEALEQSITGLSSWEPRLRNLNISSVESLNEEQLSRIEYANKELKDCEKFLGAARKAWSELRELEDLERTIDSNVNSLNRAKEDMKQALTDHIPKALATMMNSITCIKKATQDLDKVVTKFVCSEMLEIKARKKAVQNHGRDFKTAVSVLDWCTPVTGIGQAESARLIRSIESQITKLNSESDMSLLDRVTTLKNKYKDWRANLTGRSRSARESPNLDDKICSLKTGLELRMESAHSGWETKYARIANDYLSKGESLIDNAIAKGNTFMSSARSASTSMSADEWDNLTKARKAWSASLEQVDHNTCELLEVPSLAPNNLPFLIKSNELDKLKEEVTEAERIFNEVKQSFE